jgi:hypothetical protein
MSYRHSTPEELAAALDPELRELFGEPIHTYTRAQAIDDGVLIDLTDEPFDVLLHAAGFRLHTVISDSAFIAALGSEYDARNVVHVSRMKRLLSTLHTAIRSMAADDDRIYFDFPTNTGERNGDPVAMWARVHGGDRGEAVLTIMLQGED